MSHNLHCATRYMFRTPVGLTYDEAGAVLGELRSQLKSIKGG